MAMTDKAICVWAKCEVRVWGDHKIPVMPNAGITKLDAHMIGGITKIPRPNSDRFFSPPLPLFRLCPLGCLEKYLESE